MPSSMIMFVMQGIVSFTVLLFCIGMLAGDHDTSLYLPILTSILG